MILHPGILALLLGSGLVLVLLLLAVRTGVVILLRWNPSSADEEQLALERRTELVTTLVNYAFVFLALSLPLFVFTLDDLHRLFTGAMCATGTLNANPVGWAVLGVKLALFFLAGLWVVVNHYDQQVETAPLVRFKYLALIVIAPLVVADLVLQLVYFLGLDPQIITSCCGALFSLDGDSVASELAGLPPAPMMVLFYAAAGGFLLLLALNLVTRKRWLTRILALVSLFFLPIALVAVVSFISLYIYELPTHHCPFDLLQSGHHFIGYPLYLSLFGAVLAGVVPELLAVLRRRGGLSGVAEKTERRWVVYSLVCLVLFLLLSTWPVVFGRLSLRGYF